jgi:hypothetical protein
LVSYPHVLKAAVLNLGSLCSPGSGGRGVWRHFWSSQLGQS